MLHIVHSRIFVPYILRQIVKICLTFFWGRVIVGVDGASVLLKKESNVKALTPGKGDCYGFIKKDVEINGT